MISFSWFCIRTPNPPLFLPQRAYDLKNNQVAFLFPNSKPDICLNYNPVYRNWGRLHFAITHLLGGCRSPQYGWLRHYKLILCYLVTLLKRGHWTPDKGLLKWDTGLSRSYPKTALNSKLRAGWVTRVIEEVIIHACFFCFVFVLLFPWKLLSFAVISLTFLFPEFQGRKLY